MILAVAVRPNILQRQFQTSPHTHSPSDTWQPAEAEERDSVRVAGAQRDMA